MKNILSIIFIALAVGTYFVYISPQYEKIKILRVEEGQYLEAQANAAELKDVYDRLATDFNNLPQSDLDRLNAFLPDSFDSTRFAMDVDAVASRYGVTLTEVQASQQVSKLQKPGEVSSPVQSNIVSIKFKASYQSAVQFMKDLESSLHLIDITRVSFLADEKGVYDFSVSLQTYSLSGK